MADGKLRMIVSGRRLDVEQRMTTKRGLPDRRMRLALLLSASAAACVLLVSACGGTTDPGAGPSPSPKAPRSRQPQASLLPDAPIGEHLAWVLKRINEGTALGQARDRSSFQQGVSLPGHARRLADGAGAGWPRRSVAIGTVLQSQGALLAARADGSGSSSLKTTIVVDPGAEGKISGLLFQPYTPVEVPTSWDAFDDLLGALASQVSFVAVDVDRGQPVLARNPEQAGAIGSGSDCTCWARSHRPSPTGRRRGRSASRRAKPGRVCPAATCATSRLARSTPSATMPSR